ncbi:MAG: transcription antitermination factor NusB [Bdellovibrionota bacterium]|nr:transcription antitermination factor NusB [Bdellovibrionota bacterium]
MNNSKIREFSFQYLFHLQLPIFEAVKKELSTSKVDLRDSLQEFRSSSEIKLTGDEFDSAVTQIHTAASNADELEEKITPFLKNWTLNRISKVDRTVLLLAVNEFQYLNTPEKVVINEAVELAKKYGTEDSPKFVNAVLDNIIKN